MAKWEFLGLQELTNPGKGGLFGGGFTSRTFMWRSKVPGGWLILFCKSAAFPEALPQVSASLFYPDAAHEWNGGLEEEETEKVLLRPALGATQPEEQT
jgi:hypothetical protein